MHRWARRSTPSPSALSQKGQLRHEGSAFLCRVGVGRLHGKPKRNANRIRLSGSVEGRPPSRGVRQGGCVNSVWGARRQCNLRHPCLGCE
ncbi:hypothetical protein BGZ61DRAFT_460133 [Ilyonectria robusta]|uniref:uncharacterized protein n=1 Tax=Ilyonectria robusta TaxID=1079257 RepID=UPI001E8D5379|nr:uncharacterized protein BGZ61DRAFT_460133 [Ilyonectria robusta]KAH8669873.1 hypothetical protein BGZ61DRAFT_460133 [Ilyonectria robusta]